MSRFDEATDALRSTAKWLVTALTGTAAALVAGVQLTGLGELEGANWPRLIVATVALGVALGSIGVLIRDTARILTDEFVTLTDLQDAFINAQLTTDPARGAELRRLEDRVKNLREELYRQAAPDLGTLQRRLREANTVSATIVENSVTYSQQEIDQASERVRVLRAAAQEVADYANYDRIRTLTSELRRKRSAVAGAAAAGIVVFAWATNPASPNKPVKVQIERSVPTPDPTHHALGNNPLNGPRGSIG